jgi:hypothetical protein
MSSSRQMRKSTTTAVAATWVVCYSAMRGAPIVCTAPSDRQAILRDALQNPQIRFIEAIHHFDFKPEYEQGFGKRLVVTASRSR